MPKINTITGFINKQLYSTKQYDNIDVAIKKYSSVFGKSAGEYLSKQINNINPKKDSLSIKHKTASMDLINAVLYPVRGLPIDLLESFLLKFKKIVPNSKKINKILNSQIIKKHNHNKKLQAKYSAISNCLDSMALPENEIFKQGQNRLNPIISTYSSDKERAVNRLSSGLVPAIFYANDAYNQSMMINNNKTEAKQEKSRRFKQEVTRIGIMAYTQFVVLGALSKYVNKSAALSIATTTAIVAGTEMLSRVFAGKHITFLKSKKNKNEEHPLVDIANDDSTIKHTSKALKFIGGFLTIGALMSVTKNTKLGKKVATNITKKYDKLINKDVYITKDEFKVIKNKLNENGFDKLASNYNNIVANQQGDKIYLGKEGRKIINPLVDSIIMSPIKTAFNIATAPFDLIFKSKKTPTIIKKTNNELQGLKYIKSIQNQENFSDKLNKKILSSFDNKTKTNYSNHNLAKYSKVTTSAVSSYFIVADSYNMVIEKENNKNNAKKVAKHVLLQRAVNIGLGAYILTALNNVFKMQYNKSLYGVAFVAGLFGLMNEGLSRLAVGIPVTEKTREEQLKFRKSYAKLFNLNKSAA